MLVKKAISVLKFIYPYILILLVSLLSNWLLFQNGIAAGDDIRFHLFQINDLVYGFRQGYFGLSTNHLYMGGFALNNYGFYGPVPHYSAAIAAFLFADGNAEFGYKTIIFLSTFIGGIYFYKLSLRMTKNTVVSIITASLFVVMPYRIFCTLCRCAFAEVVAINFIPMIFYGAYAIVHDEEYRVEPYISLVIGASIVIMSHPFTGMMCGIFGVLYLACNIGVLLRKKNFHIWPSLVASGLLVFCLVGFYIGNALTTKDAGIYRLNDPIIDWTNYDHVANSTQLSMQFSGFLNFIWINGQKGSTQWNDETVSSLIMSLFIYLLSFVNMVIADSTLKLVPKNKYFRWAANIVAIFLFPLIIQTRVEIWIACIISVVLFNAVSYLFEDKKAATAPDFSTLKYNPDLYYLIGTIFICLILIFVPTIWKILPEIFYQCQFAWRMWGICMFFFVMLITLLLNHLQKYKGAVISFASFAALLICLSQGLIEKRVHYEVGGRIFENIDIAYVETNTEARYSGAQNEMVPYVIMDSSYKSQYSNSLVTSVRSAIFTRNNFIYSLETYQLYKPVFLTGSGNVQITNYNSPNNSFNVSVTSETALVQFPQFYNQVYEAYSNGQSLGEAQNIDGLIAFSLPEGNYSLDLVFKGSKGYQIGKPFFYASFPGLISFGLFGIYYRRKTSPKKKEESLDS